jgi:hydrogenase maturation factor
MRQGWTRNSLKVGDVVIVSGYVARDGSRLASARSANLVDGRNVLTGPSGQTGTTKW